jgi:ribosomal protein S2
MRIKQKKTITNTINYIYKIILQNNIKFGHSQYLTDKKLNLFVFQTKHHVEFFNTIDVKNILYKIFLYIKTLYQLNNNENNFLFATTTTVYSDIIKMSAIRANAIYHIDR